MWEPVGPLPASVYWRRRWLAVASTVVAVLLVMWSLAALLGGGSSEPDITATRTANTAVLNAPQQAPSVLGSGVDRSDGPDRFDRDGPTVAVDVLAVGSPTGNTVEAGGGGVTPPVASVEGTPATTSEELRPDETPRKSVPAATPVPVPSTGPVPCTNAMLTVGSEIDRPQHKVGDKPVLRLVITNTSSQPCVRDLDSAKQEIVVWNSNQTAKLWSSNDCSNASSADLRTLVPGQPVAFAVTWAGRTSTPGCAQPRLVVPAGSYRVLTRLDGIISAPTLFTITP